MLYELKSGKVITKSIEYSVSYHCNLRCSGCSHMSPFLGKRFPSIESFSSDIHQLSKGLHAEIIRLLGGEPLLNPEISSFIKVTKKSGIADKIMVTTNGLLLHKMNDDFWENVDFILVNLYPGAPLKERLGYFKERANQFHTRLWMDPVSKFRTTIVTDPHPRDWVTGMIFKTCKDVHLWHCHMIYEGKLYKCAVPPFLPEYLSKMGKDGYDSAREGFDLYKTRNFVEELKDFLLSPKTLEACRFCLGYLGKWQDHHQIEAQSISDPGLLNITRKEALDRNRFLKECARYYIRRVASKFLREQMW